MNVAIKRKVSGQFVATCLVLAIVAADTGIVACRAEPRPKNIVLICVDTLRSDHLGGYGYDRSTTPNLDSLAAEEGITFENAYASSSWTLPSVTSVFTSLHAPQHGVEDQGTRLSEDATTLAERLSGHDWLTAAFVTHIYVSSLFGLDQGFSEFHELSIDWDFREGLQLRANQLNQNVLPWLEDHSDSRFFLYLHYFDPHWEYDPPGPFRASFTDPDYLGPADGTWEHLRHYLSPEHLMSTEDLQQTEGLYDGEILWTDHHLGLLFNAMKGLGLWDQSLIVIFGDHGEEFQEHGSVHHTKTLYEEVLRVPLLIKLPGGRPTDVRPRIDERVRLMDIAPTILELAGLDPSPDVEGLSLLSSLEKRGDDRDVFAHTRRNEANKMALLTDDWKFIFTYTPGRESVELFDLARDPLEQASVTRFQRDLAKKLWQDAESRFQTMLRWNHEHLAPSNPVDLTPDQKEHLRTLGYVE